MVTPIIPKTKNALFRVVDKFFITDGKVTNKLYDIKGPLSKMLAQCMQGKQKDIRPISHCPPFPSLKQISHTELIRGSLCSTIDTFCRPSRTSIDSQLIGFWIFSHWNLGVSLAGIIQLKSNNRRWRILLG
jgi:hypothetical protein